jgi:hypothetical protein
MRITMELDKQQIVNMLRGRGDHEKAQKAEQELPDKSITSSTQTCSSGSGSTRRNSSARSGSDRIR